MSIPPASYCTTKQYYSSALPAVRGLSPLLAPLSIGSPPAIYNSTLPLELLLVRSPLLKKSTFVSSPVLSDMLKSRTYSCISAPLQPRGLHHAYRILYVVPRMTSLSILYMGCVLLFVRCTVSVHLLNSSVDCYLYVPGPAAGPLQKGCAAHQQLSAGLQHTK